MVFRQHGEHKFAYDFETLRLALETAGFMSVFKQAFSRSLMSDLCIDAERRASESLYVEAQKDIARSGSLGGSPLASNEGP